MYSIHSERKSVVAERCIRTLKTKYLQIHDFNIKKVYINKLDDIVNEYNNKYHRTIKRKPVGIKDNTHIDSSREVDVKDHKFKFGDHVKISKYKNISAEGYTPNWSE